MNTYSSTNEVPLRLYDAITINGLTMPKDIEESIQHSLRKAHPEWSDTKVKTMTYKTMNSKRLWKGKARKSVSRKKKK